MSINMTKINNIPEIIIHTIDDTVDSVPKGFTCKNGFFRNPC